MDTQKSVKITKIACAAVIGDFELKQSNRYRNWQPSIRSCSEGIGQHAQKVSGHLKVQKTLKMPKIACIHSFDYRNSGQIWIPTLILKWWIHSGTLGEQLRVISTRKEHHGKTTILAENSRGSQKFCNDKLHHQMCKQKAQRSRVIRTQQTP